MFDIFAIRNLQINLFLFFRISMFRFFDDFKLLFEI